jgi:hypothetical protein
MIASSAHVVTVERDHQDRTRYRGACTCTWRGPWRQGKFSASIDNMHHLTEP